MNGGDVYGGDRVWQVTRSYLGLNNVRALGEVGETSFYIPCAGRGAVAELRDCKFTNPNTGIASSGVAKALFDPYNENATGPALQDDAVIKVYSGSYCAYTIFSGMNQGCADLYGGSYYTSYSIMGGHYYYREGVKHFYGGDYYGPMFVKDTTTGKATIIIGDDDGSGPNIYCDIDVKGTVGLIIKGGNLKNVAVNNNDGATISGGSIESVTANTSADTTIEGGNIQTVTVGENGNATISGGTVDTVEANGAVDVTGGTIKTLDVPEENAGNVNLSGGQVENGVPSTVSFPARSGNDVGTLPDMLAKGGSVTVGKEVTVDEGLTVKSTGDLDLCGNNVNANYLVAFGNVKDGTTGTADEGKALLKVPMGSLLIGGNDKTNGGVLPIYDSTSTGGGYRFITVTPNTNTGLVVNDTDEKTAYNKAGDKFLDPHSMIYRFRPEANNSSFDALLAAGYSKSGVKVVLTVSYEIAANQEMPDTVCTYTDNVLKNLAKGGGVLTYTIKGLNSLADGDKVTVSVKLVSGLVEIPLGETKTFIKGQTANGTI